MIGRWLYAHQLRGSLIVLQRQAQLSTQRIGGVTVEPSCRGYMHIHMLQITPMNEKMDEKMGG